MIEERLLIEVLENRAAEGKNTTLTPKVARILIDYIHDLRQKTIPRVSSVPYWADSYSIDS